MAPARRSPPEARTQEVRAPMSTASYGAGSRRPVYSGTRRVPGLYERRLADGSSVFDVALRLGGKSRRVRLTARTKTDAISELRALQVDYERGEPQRSSAVAPTIAELAADFDAHMRARVGDRDPKRRRSPRTVRLCRDHLRLHVQPVLGSRTAAELTVADLRRLLDELARKGLAPSSRTGVLTALSALMRYGIKQGVVERNVVRDLDRDDRPGSGRLTEPRYLTPSELERLLARMGDTFLPLAAVCAFAGLRLSETLALRWRDVDLEAATLTVSAQLGPGGDRLPLKTAASAATVPMLPVLVRELRAHRSRIASKSLRRLHRDAFVFTTARGRPQGARNALRAVHAAGDAVGLNADGRERVGVHDLRHSCIAIALASGFTLPEAAALARHANPRVTATVYAGLTDENRGKLAAKLADAFA
jgi:integrase